MKPERITVVPGLMTALRKWSGKVSAADRRAAAFEALVAPDDVSARTRTALDFLPSMRAEPNCLNRQARAASIDKAETREALRSLWWDGEALWATDRFVLAVYGLLDPPVGEFVDDGSAPLLLDPKTRRPQADQGSVLSYPDPRNLLPEWDHGASLRWPGDYSGRAGVIPGDRRHPAPAVAVEIAESWFFLNDILLLAAAPGVPAVVAGPGTGSNAPVEFRLEGDTHLRWLIMPIQSKLHPDRAVSAVEDIL